MDKDGYASLKVSVETPTTETRMTRYQVTHLFCVEVDAEDSVTAEAKAKNLAPTNSQIQQVGKMIRTHWSMELVTEHPDV